MPSSGRFRFLSERRAAAERALGGWARRRQGPDLPPLVLQPRRIYILPTRTGVAAAVLLFVMLLAGLNYNNSLALMLCFMLCGVLFVSMYECHRSLSGLGVTRAEIEPAFAHADGIVRLQLDNRDRRARAGLRLRCAPCAPVTITLASGAAASLCLQYRARRRGRQPLERIELATRTPLGMFRAWTWLHVPLEAVIYPAPISDQPLPPPRGAQPLADTTRGMGEEEWAWLRPFRQGDPPRSIAWKAYARDGVLLAAHYEAPAGARRVLDLSQLAPRPLETQLSVLAGWVLECERRGEPYALALPGHMLPEGLGRAQRHACLEALALFGL